MVEAFWLIVAFGIGAIGTLVFINLFMCSHSYETRIHKVDSYYSDGTYRKTYWIYTNTCKHCGKVKTKMVGK